MSNNRSNVGALVGGAVLVAMGLLSLTGQLFSRLDFWGMAWPFFVIGFGALFFVGMFAGGRSVSGLAIPGAIITTIGLMLFVQNVFNYWQSWSYGWTVILVSVGLGIFIMGWYAENESQRRSGIKLMKIGAVLFLIFGGFFETIFNSFVFSKFLFPAALILLGIYLIAVRSGLVSRKQDQVDDAGIPPAIPPSS
jgi:hypothetical protein